jgi:DNA mismatch endonuclease (patch repair protein)
MMSGIRGRNTSPELYLRKSLHRLGFRFRVNQSKLPGSPDIVFPKYHAVIFVNGCFWHAHDCRAFKWPKTNPDFWREKIAGNLVRDGRNLKDLRSAGWRTLVVWECAIRASRKKNAHFDAPRFVSQWLLCGVGCASLSEDGLIVVMDVAS